MVVVLEGKMGVFSQRVTSTGSLPPTRQSSMSSCPRIDSEKYRGARYSETVTCYSSVDLLCMAEEGKGWVLE